MVVHLPDNSKTWKIVICTEGKNGGGARMEPVKMIRRRRLFVRLEEIVETVVPCLLLVETCRGVTSGRSAVT